MNVVLSVDRNALGDTLRHCGIAAPGSKTVCEPCIIGRRFNMAGSLCVLLFGAQDLSPSPVLWHLHLLGLTEVMTIHQQIILVS